MFEFVLWFIAVEALGLAALPLAMALLPRLADRGYGLAKVLGILLVTFVNYLLGSLLGLGNNTPLLALGMVVLLAVGVVALGTDRAGLAAWLRAHRSLIAVEELIFLALFIIWALYRAAHPGILSTEKPMDMAMMTASHKATSFPPYDPWLAGTTINYYYGGYLAVGTLVTLTGVAPAIGFNLAVALLFALVGTAAYSIVYNLSRDLRWAVLGTVFVLLIGNLDGLAQLLDPTRGVNGFEFFHSSRIVEPNNCFNHTTYCTITEFPAFSYLLGDLHPHVIALPFTILAIGVALNLALAPAAGWIGLGATNLRRALTLILAALATGALFFMNSWDWPTYLVLCGAALLLPGLRTLDRRALGEGLALALGVLVLGYVLFISFRLDFKPQYSSFGLLPHGSPTGQVLTMFGLFLLPAAAFVVGGLGRGAAVTRPLSAPSPGAAALAGTTPARAVTAARRGGSQAAVIEREPDDGDAEVDDELPRLPTFGRRKPRQNGAHQDNGAEPVPDGGDADGDDELPRLPLPGLPRLGASSGGGLSLVMAAIVLWIVFHAVGLATVGLLLPFALATLYLAYREARAGQATNAFALLLCAGGIGLVIMCDLLYLKDNFCGAIGAGGNCTGDLYRMNTVFKFYYQAWTVLALGAAYGLYYLAGRVRGANWRRYLSPVAAAAIVVAGGVYLVLGLFTPTTNVYTTPVAHAAATLDGSAYLDSYTGTPITITNAIPDDAAAIRWLNATVTGHPTILEADQVQSPGYPPGPQDYWPFPGDATQQALMMSRISVFTGLPAVLGSGYSHEGLWHGDAIVGTRFQDVQTMYTSADRAAVKALLQKYDVRYIYVGQVEAYVYYRDESALVDQALTRLKSFGTVVYNAKGVTIIRVS